MGHIRNMVNWAGSSLQWWPQRLFHGYIGISLPGGWKMVGRECLGARKKLPSILGRLGHCKVVGNALIVYEKRDELYR